MPSGRERGLTCCPGHQDDESPVGCDPSPPRVKARRRCSGAILHSPRFPVRIRSRAECHFPPAVRQPSTAMLIAILYLRPARVLLPRCSRLPACEASPPGVNPKDLGKGVEFRHRKWMWWRGAARTVQEWRKGRVRGQGGSERIMWARSWRGGLGACEEVGG